MDSRSASVHELILANSLPRDGIISCMSLRSNILLILSQNIFMAGDLFDEEGKSSGLRFPEYQVTTPSGERA